MQESKDKRSIEPEKKDPKNPSTASSEPPPVPFRKLFRYATARDWFFMTVGLIACIANGVALPAFALVFGSITDSLNPNKNDPDEIVRLCGKFSLFFLGIGLGSFVLSYLSFACWMISGERQAIEYRKQYLRALITQEIGFFDTINPNELSSKIANECFAIQGAIGEKVATFVFAFAMMCSGFIIGFVKGWQLALVLCACIPVMTVSGSLFVYALQKSSTFSTQAYNSAGAVAEECLNGIRTVVALGGIDREVARYRATLLHAKARVIKFGFFGGFALGSIFFAMMSTYALGFWFGSKLIEDQTTNSVTGEPYNTADVMTTFFSVLFGAFSTSQTTPCVEAFTKGKNAAAKTFIILEKKSKIDVTKDVGIKPTSVEGKFEFKDVKFAYPLKPEKIILNEVSFTIRPNEKTALVGESGCGKTTCMQLIERFYDLNSGSISLDGNKITDLNLRWLRSQIGYVGQEPVLFATTIRENMLFAKENATEEEIWEALKKANAFTFVSNLPQKLETFVGTSGTQLSGGQKQRLAIARAILKNPRILLLDEATSALDRKNELEIQQTLDSISEGRTSIVIAHRLTTIQNSHNIIVFDQGKIVEEGNHDTLMAKKSRYYELNHLQVQGHEEKKEGENSSNEEDSPEFNDSPIPKEREFARMATGNQQLDIKVDPVIVDDVKLPEPEQVKVPSLKKEGSTRERKASEHKHEHQHKEEKTEEQKKQEEAENKKKEAAEKKKLEGQIMSRLLSYNKEEKPILILGCICALVNGAIFPCFSIILAGMLEVFTNPFASDYRTKANFYALMFFICAILALIFNSLQLGLMGYVGENLTLKVRTDVFKKLLKMNIGWYDQPENSPGALATKLSTDCTLVNSLTSSTLGISIQALSSFITGMVIAFIASWQLTLVTLAISPLLVLAGKIQAAFNQGFSAANDGPYKDSAGFITEAVTNMRTVASFGKEENLMKLYEKKLQPPLDAAIKKGNVSGLAFGFSQFAMFGMYAVVFYVGALFTREPNIKLGFKDMFQSIFGVMFAAFGSGNASQFAPDAGAAKAAAMNIFKLLDRKPEVDMDDASQTLKTPIRGDIEFKNVWFKYPSRSKHVLRGVSFKINATKKVAFVGPSGCGKSTVMSLLLRYYDIESGEILIDGHSIREYDLQHLRSSFGVVSQEPLLFNGSIEYNIKYSRENATDDEMREVAKQANALGFIENNEFESINPDDAVKFGTGFKRMVGPKGSQISGGQKQRIAISRAILNKPNVLLLDEATSALDSQNEKVVQESLDKIMAGKTSIVVAHRISTIKDSDQIYVFQDGEIVEHGTYDELNKLQKVFYRLERGLPTN